jgi:hypothetical protein
MVPLAQELKDDFMKNSPQQSAGSSSCNTNPTKRHSQEYYETCFDAGRKQAELFYREKRKRRSSIESGAFFSRLKFTSSTSTTA